jgi:hypothetical protein
MEHSIGIGLKWRYGVSIRLLVFDKSPAAFHIIPVCVFMYYKNGRRKSVLKVCGIYSKPNYKKVYRKTYPKRMGAPG